MKPTKEQCEAIAASHANASLIETESHAIIVRPPTRQEFKRFVASADKGGADKATALEQIVRDCLLWPEQDQLGAILDDKPFLMAKFADELSAMGGAEERATRKKL